MIDYATTLVSTLFINVAATAYRCGWCRPDSICPRSSAKRSRAVPSASQKTGSASDKDDGTRSKKDFDGVRSRRDSSTKIASDATIERVEIDPESWDDSPRPCFACVKIDGEAEMKRRHRSLLYFTYLPVYLLAASADWLQGPYKYAVYSAYGYDQRAIAFLFVAGFGSGMSIGAIIGGLADSWGRKRMACAYCCVYILSCLAKHVRHFGVLLWGRVLGGIAASLLFSVFDAWLIKAHSVREIDKCLLAASFSAANYGSSVVAIVAGLLANSVVGQEGDHPLQPVFSKEESVWVTNGTEALRNIGADDPRWDVAILYKGGGIRAFDVALIPLVLCFILAVVLWEENYGNRAEKVEDMTGSRGKMSGGIMCRSLRDSMLTVWRSTTIFNLCSVCAFFEGAMYVFIFQWTPALRALDTDYSGGPPLGTIFATFMVCCMLGTSAFSIAVAYQVPPQRILIYVLALSTASCAIVSVSGSAELSYAAMLVYEGCIGAYWPAISTVKAQTVPEHQRAAIYNIFRFPMNLIVLVNLLTNLTFKRSFGLCGIMLAIATVLMVQMTQTMRMDKGHSFAEEECEVTSLIGKKDDCDGCKVST